MNIYYIRNVRQCVLSSLSMYTIKGYSVLIRWVVSGLIACVMPYKARPLVSRDTSLHKQLDVIQPSESTSCTGIMYAFIKIVHVPTIHVYCNSSSSRMYEFKENLLSTEHV